MTPEQLMSAYPFLDHLMAETLVKAHETGTLNDYLADMPEPIPGPGESFVIKDAISVENATEKIPQLDLSEESCADSSQS